MALQMFSARIGLAAALMITLKSPPSVGSTSRGFLLGRKAFAILGVATSQAGRDGREGVEVPWTRYVHGHLSDGHGGEMSDVGLPVQQAVKEELRMTVQTRRTALVLVLEFATRRGKERAGP
jgi:hypothetical protein